MPAGHLIGSASLGACPVRASSSTASHLPLGADGPPHVLVGAARRARRRRRRASSLRVVVPPTSEGGTTPVRIDELPGETAYLEVARVLATGVHQVDSPVFDRLGRLYVTHSGSRGHQGAGAAVSRRVRTACASRCRSRSPIRRRWRSGPDGAIYVSSRFDGHVYRIDARRPRRAVRHRAGRADRVWRWRRTARCSSAIGRDRSCACRQTRQVETFARCRASVAAFHLAFGPDGCLYVTAPTLASHDPIYRITPDRLVDVVCRRIRPAAGPGVRLDGHALRRRCAGGRGRPLRSGLTRAAGRTPELVLSASGARSASRSIRLAASCWRRTTRSGDWRSRATARRV